MDACLHYCEIHELEIEYLGELIRKNSRVKSRIEIEAEKLNFLPKTNRLDFIED
jgi:hypothetical protein